MSYGYFFPSLVCASTRMDMRRYETDLVVMLPTEVRADTSLASPMNGIEVSPDPMGGFQANCELSMRSGLYTAGDAASLPHPICEILLLYISPHHPICFLVTPCLHKV